MQDKVKHEFQNHDMFYVFLSLFTGFCIKRCTLTVRLQDSCHQKQNEAKQKNVFLLGDLTYLPFWLPREEANNSSWHQDHLSPQP